ncbi:MAG: SMC family ATPase [Candidatus Thermoplasmatota archaeon]|nr:SMC family ATPase [Candidatus Thermoplasmatota archaeon]
MKIKSITIRMIRSHVDTTIRFPDGITLIGGDVGSGKSTVLMALEFAIFGFSGEKAGDILRLGEDRGSVDLVFEMDGTEYTVSRSISRKGTVIEQKQLSLSYAGKQVRLSASEMKKELLRILGYRDVASASSKNWIYRSAVFTPQESMKDILSQDPKGRMTTLRKILGIDDYSVASANAVNLRKRLERESERLNGAASSLSEMQQSLDEEKNRIVELENSLRIAESKVSWEQGVIRELDSSMAELRKRRDEMIRTRSEISGNEKSLARFRGLLEQEKGVLDRKISDLRASLEKLSSIAALRKLGTAAPEQINSEINQLVDSRAGLNSELGKLREKIKEYRHAIRDGKCPFCHRPLTGDDFWSHLKEKENSVSEIMKSIDEIDGVIAAKRKLLADTLEFSRESARIEQIRKNAEDLTNEISELEKKINSHSYDIENLEKQTVELRKKLETFGSLEKEIAEMEDKRRVSDEALKKAIAEASGAKASLGQSRGFVEKATENVRKLRGFARKASEMREYYMWIDSFLVRAFAEIEKEVIAHDRADFERYFSQWFSRLVTDIDLSAIVDESFGPVINYGRFTQEISSLSGGEKTSVAIAYRLALNSLIHSVAGGSSDMLILDEPTDGFSKEQIGRMGEIIRELGLRQVIIVSHEVEMESFADNLIRLSKEGGITRVVG